MKLYIVKHQKKDYRLHDEDGTEIEQWNNRPDKSEIASKLSDPWRISTEGYNYRDLTISDETVPWQS